MRRIIFSTVLFFLAYKNVNAQTYHQANIGSLTGSTNANATTGYGTYDFTIGNGTGNTNYPTGVYGYGNLINFTSANFGTQFIVTNSSSTFYLRSSYGSTWQPWVQVWTTGNFTPSNYLPLAGGTITGTATVNSGANNSSNKVLQVTSPDGHSLVLSSSLGTTNYNGIVQTGDQGLIFSAGSIGTGSFCIAPWAAATSGIRMLTNGNVLIGKASQVNSVYMLDVNGNIRANQLVVNNTGADFVFEPGYKLMPLDEVAEFIKANHHLLGMAPAAQMQKEGVSVGDNQTKLLQKIEELTLYIIGQDKIQKQQAKINEQQDKIIEAQGKLLQQLQQQLAQLAEVKKN